MGGGWMIDHRRREVELAIAEHQARTLGGRISISNREATPKQKWPPHSGKSPAIKVMYLETLFPPQPFDLLVIDLPAFNAE